MPFSLLGRRKRKAGTASPVLVPQSATLSGSLFENPRIGIARDLFWNVEVDLEPVELDGETWDCSFACEWLTWPVRRLADLDGMTLDQVIDPNRIEASLYVLAQHHPATISRLEISEQAPGRYRLAVAGSAEVSAEQGMLNVPFSLVCDLDFVGIFVVRENLFPKPANPAEVQAALNQFISPEGFAEPREDGFRYVVQPASV